MSLYVVMHISYWLSCFKIVFVFHYELSEELRVYAGTWIGNRVEKRRGIENRVRKRKLKEKSGCYYGIRYT